ncbi:hypothetical protein C8R46DRAFT_1232562 [Mycena filopes]|nr:hypothetical protein C8R46DRAFT_1232562 [Mycena filopes]
MRALGPKPPIDSLIQFCICTTEVQARTPRASSAMSFSSKLKVTGTAPPISTTAALALRHLLEAELSASTSSSSSSKLKLSTAPLKPLVPPAPALRTTNITSTTLPLLARAVTD